MGAGTIMGKSSELCLPQFNVHHPRLTKISTPKELDANSKLVDETKDALYDFDGAKQKKVNEEKPWRGNPNYYKTVRISSIALIKMVMHARSGGSIEVMGLMQGYTEGTALVVTDAYRLPVEGTETRVNAQEQANEYMVEYLRLCRENWSREENVIGWYHSHPGYGCWLSGIDVDTQKTQQTWADPFVAVVIDPDRTVSAGKVEIGAFRTYPENHRSEAASGGFGADGYQTVPLNKAADFGAHSSSYYSLEVEHYKSTLDAHLLELLWNKYWVGTLSQNPLLTNRDYSNKQMLDLAGKVKEATDAVVRSARGGHGFGANGKVLMETTVDNAVRDSRKVAANETTGLMASEVKVKMFSSASDSA
jgi:COP9 signalosome complex subunit 5